MFRFPGNFAVVRPAMPQLRIFDPNRILTDPLGAVGDILDQIIRAGAGDFSATRAEDCRIRPNAIITETARLLLLRALTQYGLTPLFRNNPVNFPSLTAQLFSFLVWKLQGPENFCRRYAQQNTEFFYGEFTDEAAAFLLGLLDFSAGRGAPQLILPTRLLIYVRNRNPNMAANCLSVLVNFVGMDPSLAQVVCPGLSQIINQPMPVFAVDLPRNANIGNGLIQRMVEALVTPVVTQAPSIQIAPPMR